MIDQLRTRIDKVDRELVELLNERARVAMEIGKEKMRMVHVEEGHDKEDPITTTNTAATATSTAQAAPASVDIYHPAREHALLTRLSSISHGPLPTPSLLSIYREILSASRALQASPLAIAFLGPYGTFSHQAAVDKFGASATYVPHPSIGKVFAAVFGGGKQRGEGNGKVYGLVPFENSVAGVVGETLDGLREWGGRVEVKGECFARVRLCLAAQKGAKLQHVRRVYSHAKALGASRRWLSGNLPLATLHETSSTAHAAQSISNSPATGADCDPTMCASVTAADAPAAAVCSAFAAGLYGLQVLEEGIEDISTNATRFFVVGERGGSSLPAPASSSTSTSFSPLPPLPTANNDEDKPQLHTLLHFTLDHRQPGALCDSLKVFKDHRLNLTHIATRPSRWQRWHYCFFVEFEGSIGADALRELKGFCLECRVLGSYLSWQRVAGTAVAP